MTATQLEPSAVAREGLAAIERHCFYANRVIPQLTPDAPAWIVDLADEVHDLVALNEALDMLAHDRYWSALEQDAAYRATRHAVVNEALRRGKIEGNQS